MSRIKTALSISSFPFILPQSYQLPLYFPYFITIPFPLFSLFLFCLFCIFPLPFTFPKSIHVQWRWWLWKSLNITQTTYIHTYCTLMLLWCVIPNNITNRRLTVLWVLSKSNKSPCIIFKRINFSSFFLSPLLSPSTLQLFSPDNYIPTYLYNRRYLLARHTMYAFHFFISSPNIQTQTQTTEKHLHKKSLKKYKTTGEKEDGSRHVKVFFLKSQKTFNIFCI